MVGAVLAGGRSRRMGAPKPGVLLAGRPLIAHVLGAVRAAGLEAVVVTRRETALPALDAPVVFDSGPVVHPFTGVVAALDHAGEPLVAVGADMPFLTAALLRRLAATGAPLAVCRAGGLLEPLCARYTTAVRDELARAAAARAPMRETLAALGPVLIDADPADVANVNTPEELAAAEARLRGSLRGPSPQ